jgi:hypothetical protein
VITSEILDLPWTRSVRAGAAENLCIWKATLSSPCLLNFATGHPVTYRLTCPIVLTVVHFDGTSIVFPLNGGLVPILGQARQWNYKVAHSTTINHVIPTSSYRNRDMT